MGAHVKVGRVGAHAPGSAPRSVDRAAFSGFFAGGVEARLGPAFEGRESGRPRSGQRTSKFVRNMPTLPAATHGIVADGRWTWRASLRQSGRWGSNQKRCFGSEASFSLDER